MKQSARQVIRPLENFAYMIGHIISKVANFQIILFEIDRKQSRLLLYAPRDYFEDLQTLCTTLCSMKNCTFPMQCKNEFVKSQITCRHCFLCLAVLAKKGIPFCVNIAVGFLIITSRSLEWRTVCAKNYL